VTSHLTHLDVKFNFEILSRYNYDNNLDTVHPLHFDPHSALVAQVLGSQVVNIHHDLFSGETDIDRLHLTVREDIQTELRRSRLSTYGHVSIEYEQSGRGVS